jgi:hypothetical protein
MHTVLMMKNTKHTAPAAKDFSVKVRNVLARRGMAIVGSTWLPGANGSFANGERGYIIDDCGTQRIKSYADLASYAAQAA